MDLIAGGGNDNLCLGKNVYDEYFLTEKK